MSFAGRAPTVRAFSWPWWNTASIGIDWMWYRADSSGSRSVSTFTTRKSPACCAAIFSSSGATIRHGPHHAAQ